VSVAPPSTSELDVFRERADRFIADIDEEYYLHYAGLKETLDLTPIYERYPEVTSLQQAQSLAAAANGGHGIRELWRFATDGYLGELTRELTEKEARLEAELEAEIGEEKIPFRQIRPTIANEPDRARREELERARNRLVEEHLNPLHLESARTVHGAVPDLGAPTYLELHKRFGFELDRLADQCRRFLDSTEAVYETAADKLFRESAGVSLSEAQRWDTARVFRATAWDSAFPKDRMVPALESSLADLGIDLSAQPNVHLDLEDRPLKSPRAFCAPIEVPEKVMLVIRPMGGPDDWRALFHEAGHTEHFAHTSPDLAVEDRRLGDNAVTESWAMLLEHLVDEPAWLTRRLDVPRPQEFAAEGASRLLLVVRRYCAKLLYELEFHTADDPEGMSSRYVELLGDALKIEPSPTDYLADIDSGFYVYAYLRAWASEAQMRAFLREQFGNAWFSRREAGSLLRELWSEGQRQTADELFKEVTGAELEMEAVADRIWERLGAA
jgi:oligoendopeptidase F